MSTRLTVLFLVAVVAACKSTPTDGMVEESRQSEFNETSPIVQTRLKARVDNIRYQRGVTLITNLERLAAYGEAAVPVCVEGLESDDAMTRMGCVWVIGRVGDPKTIPNLESLLDDEVDFVRYEAASQLGSLGSRSGYRVLVDGLANERVEYRYKCYEALHELTGHTFDYSHNAPEAERAEAVQKWQAWLELLESEDL